MIRIRPFKMSDASYIVKWLNDERQFKMWSADKFNYPLTVEQLASYKELYEKDEFGWIFVALNEKGVPVGHFLMRMADYEKESIHLGFIIVDPEMRGKGYGTEMIKLSIEYAFRMLKVKRVTLGVYDVNTGAKAFYERIGFMTESYEKEVLVYKNEKWGIYNMAIEKK